MQHVEYTRDQAHSTDRDDEYTLAMVRRNEYESLSNAFEEVDPNIEDEILEAYGRATERSPDLYLFGLPGIFHELEIPECFTSDIIHCVNYYYDFLQNVDLEESNSLDLVVVRLFEAFTISDISNKSIIDIVDVDKLVRRLMILVKFRNFYDVILENWKLVVFAANGSDDLTFQGIINYKLTLKDMKKIKDKVNTDSDNGKNVASDSVLIDMISCSSIPTLDFDIRKIKDGSFVSVKDFAGVLGRIGELLE